MRRLLFLALASLFFANVLPAQDAEETILWFSFYKVEEGKQAEYETVMKDYYGKIMKARIEKGCMQNWIFRRILPHTNASNYFTHMTIDVLNPGKTNYQCEGVSGATVFPEMGEGMHELLRNLRNDSRKVVYRTAVTYVAGFNRNDTAAEFAAYNFIRTYPGKANAYMDMHKEYSTDIYRDHSNQAAWHAMRRTDPAVGGSQEWNYLTIDGYDTMEQKRNRSVNIPEDMSKAITEKYGRWGEMRDLQLQVVARLILSARE